MTEFYMTIEQMMDPANFLFGVVGAVLGGLLVWLLISRRTQRSELFLQHQKELEIAQLSNTSENHQRANVELKTEIQALVAERDQQRADSQDLHSELTQLKTTLDLERTQTMEKLALLESARERMTIEFRNIANEIFENKQKIFSERSREQLDGLLKPLNEKIRDFEKKVEETYDKESKERFSLTREVKNLQLLNARISEDAINLTKALKGQSKVQGNWGEIILERVLEKSGLEKGREYEIQVSLKDEDGRRFQPDVIVHLPEGKDVIIDSKVSLTAYERYCSADNEDAGARELASHIQSLRNHLKQLGEKDYQNLKSVRSLDFVLLFVPIEAAFSLAIQHDNALFGEAFDKNIIMVAPSTLLATLRTIHNIWRYEQQNRNAQEIALTAGRLYDKFVGFVADLEEIGSRIDASQKAYDKARNKLVSGRGNLIARTESMRTLGAKVSKGLPSRLTDMDSQDDDTSESPNQISAAPTSDN